MSLFSFIDDLCLDVKSAFYMGRIEGNMKKLQKELDKLPNGAKIKRPAPNIPVPKEAYEEEDTEIFEEIPKEKVSNEDTIIAETAEDVIIQEESASQEKEQMVTGKEESPEKEQVQETEKPKAEEPVQAVENEKPKEEKTKKPNNKRVTKQKTQHSASMDLQMEDIDKILNNKRESIKVTPPGGGVGSAV